MEIVDETKGKTKKKKKGKTPDPLIEHVYVGVLQFNNMCISSFCQENHFLQENVWQDPY